MSAKWLPKQTIYKIIIWANPQRWKSVAVALSTVHGTLFQSLLQNWAIHSKLFFQRPKQLLYNQSVNSQSNVMAANEPPSSKPTISDASKRNCNNSHFVISSKAKALLFQYFTMSKKQFIPFLSLWVKRSGRVLSAMGWMLQCSTVFNFNNHLQLSQAELIRCAQQDKCFGFCRNMPPCA